MTEAMPAIGRNPICRQMSGKGSFLPAFERAEYLDRIVTVKQRMEAAGIELLVATEPANLYYLTGYDAISYYVPQFVLLALDVDDPLWVGRSQDAANARYTVFMGDDAIVGYPETYIGDPGRHPAAFVAELLGGRGWDTRTIGIEYHSRGLTVETFLQLQHHLPQARFRDAGLLVGWVRTVKSPQEIAYLRQAAAISDAAMQAGVAAIQAGVRQNDAAAAVFAALVRGTDAYGGHHPEGLMMPTGARASAPHLVWTDDPLRPGEMTNIELAGCRFSYHAGLSRTVVVGQPPAKLVDLAAATAEGMETALDAARAGVTCEAVEAVYQRAIGKHGFAKPSRIGYSIGIGYPGMGWGEDTASLQPGDRTVLEPNMTFHLMLGMWMEGWGLVMSETFRVAESGPAESFSSLERHLFVKA
jgi:Xaa-Pro aminopeptidase